jgi:hypothetical protein
VTTPVKRSVSVVAAPRFVIPTVDTSSHSAMIRDEWKESFAMYRQRNFTCPVILLAIVSLTQCAGLRATNGYPDDLIAWWQGEGDALEVVSNTYGRTEGVVVFDEDEGIQGQGFIFYDAPGQIVTDLIDMEPTNELTIEAWVYHMYLGEEIQRYVTAVGNCAEFGETTAVLRYDGGLHFYMIFDGEFYHTEAPEILRPEMIHYVVGTYSAGEMRLYCDGIEVDRLSIYEGPCCFDWVGLSSSDEPIRLGLLDEVKIRMRALTPAEIGQAYRDICPDCEPFFTAYIGEHVDESYEEFYEDGPQGYVPDGHDDARDDLVRSFGTFSASIYPTVIQIDGIDTEYDFASRDAFAQFIEAGRFADVTLIDDPLDLSASREGSQIMRYQDGLQLAAHHLGRHPISTTYAMFVECIVRRSPDENISRAWATQLYILDRHGLEVYSLLLNDHWPLFANGELVVDGISNEYMSVLAQRSVDVIISALESHITEAQNEIILRETQYTFKGHTYQWFRGTTWEDALSLCEELGGYIVAIDSPEENQFILTTFQEVFGEHIGIGLTDRNEEGEWRWVNGAPVRFTNWAANEPNNANNEDYVEFMGDGTWNDLPGFDWMPGFICEWDTVLN